MPAARKGKAPVTASPIATTNPASSSSSSSSAPGPSRPSRARQDSSASLLSPMEDPSATPTSASESQQQWTEPPWVGFLETTEDALLILEAARRRLIPRVTRRLADRERKLIQSGSVFVFEEEESGIKRWTDGFLWSPSRILGNFLLYRETDKRNPDGTPATRPGRSNTTSMPSTSTNGGASSLLVSEDPIPTAYPSGALSRPKDDLAGVAAGGYSAAGSSGLDRARERILLGSLTNSQKFKEDGMMKKTFSLTLPNTTQTHHIVSYYKVADVEAGRLRTPSSLPEFAALEISPEFLDKTHFRVQPRVEVGEDGRVRFRGETNDEPDSPSPEPPKELPSAPAAHHHPSHVGSNIGPGVPPPTSHGAHHSSHPYQRPQPHHGSSSAASHYSASVGSTNSYSGFGGSSSNVYPTAGHHSRQNSLSATSTAGSLDYSSASSTTVGGLAAAAKAQAEASQRMYMNGAAVAAAANSTTGSSSSKQFHQQAGYFPNGNGVGTTASSLGLHYPSALSTYNSSSASSSVSPPPPPPASSYAGSTTSHTSHSSARSNYSYDSYTSAYTNDNATGAPPFQAPQLYNPNQPSAGSNAQFATTSYPASLAPNRRASTNLSSTAPSVRSAMSMSTTTSAAFDNNNDAAAVAVRGSRSGSRGSDSSSISSGPGSLVSASTAASSEVATPSIASSSRRSSTGLLSSRPDPQALNKMLAAVKPEQAVEEAIVVGNGYNDFGFDTMNMNMNMMNMSFNGATGGYGAMGMVEDTLGLGMDTMIMSPVQDVGLADDQPPMTATAGTWCGATATNGYDMSAASSFQQSSYMDQQISQSPSHTSGSTYYSTTTAANGYSIPPPAPTRQKSMPSYPNSTSVYGGYQIPDQQQQQYYQHPGMMRAATMYEPSATSFHNALGGEQ